ncbi:DUF7528 family protein [Halomicrococcus gelatinilyticus]|uniref:DUF7528 family protein n=1 Tax=Halomicrococcus gelatinilyticus TaxID=1702103 RepID=UPI002E151A35
MRTGDAVEVTVGGETLRLSRDDADGLREELGRVLTERREFLHTAGERRDDGSYVVSRCSADASGHRKVFESFEALVRRYDSLPREFTAETVGETGLTGSRRHMLVHHFAEHPAFDCELVARQPLTARKRGDCGTDACNAAGGDAHADD